MDINGMGDVYLKNAITQNQYERQQASAENAKRAAEGLSAGSSREELTEAAKNFEAYFVEQVMKEVKDSVNLFGGEDQTSQMTMDYYLDSTIQTLARQLVDEYGDSFTEQLVDQMERNYGVAPENAKAGETVETETDSSEIAASETVEAAATETE